MISLSCEYSINKKTIDGINQWSFYMRTSASLFPMHQDVWKNVTISRDENVVIEIANFH